MAIQISFKPREITKKLLKALPERSADILSRRYGLDKSVKRETLESVGRSYTITRERVRQIETGALAAVRKSDEYLDNQAIFTELTGVIHDLGTIVCEDVFLKEITTSESLQNHLHFLLVIGDNFTKLKENIGFVHRWHADTLISERVHDALERVHKNIARNELLAEKEIIERLLQELGDDIEDITDYVGLAPDMGAFEYGSTASVNDPGELPQKYALHQNYPNPFNPVTTLRYNLPEDGLINITIYDIMGRVVKTLLNSSQTAGYKSTQWNATNNAGQPVSAGLYLYMIQAAEFKQSKKMVLLK